MTNYCTNCGADLDLQDGFDSDASCWICSECGQALCNPNGNDNCIRYPDTVWVCDECGAILNNQIGFTDLNETWECTQCGYENSINEGAIDEGIHKTSHSDDTNLTFADVLFAGATVWICALLSKKKKSGQDNQQKSGSSKSSKKKSEDGPDQGNQQKTECSNNSNMKSSDQPNQSNQQKMGSSKSSEMESEGISDGMNQKDNEINDVNNDLLNQIENAAEKGAGKGARKSIILFFVLVVVAISLAFCLFAIGINATFDSFKEQYTSVIDHYVFKNDLDELSLEDNGLAGHTVAEFAEAILGNSERVKKLEVYRQEITDMVALKDTGLFNLGVFTKVQYLVYHGTVVYTVDLEKLTEASITLNEEEKTVYISIPHSQHEEINIPEDSIEFGDTAKGLLAFGDIDITVEQSAKIQAGIRLKMESALKKSKASETADRYAVLSIMEMYYPLVKSISSEYALVVQLQ